MKDGDIISRLVHNLSKIKAERGLSSYDIERMAKLPIGTIDNIEKQSSDTTLKVLEALAISLEVSPVNLLA